MIARRAVGTAATLLVAAACFGIVWWSFVGFPRDRLTGMGPLTQAEVLAQTHGKATARLVVRDPGVLAALDRNLRNHREPALANLALHPYKVTVQDFRGNSRSFSCTSAEFDHHGKTPPVLREILENAEKSRFRTWNSP